MLFVPHRDEEILRFATSRYRVFCITKTQGLIVSDILKKENQQKTKGSLQRSISYIFRLAIITIILLLIVREFLFSGSYLPLDKPYTKLIFDMHCHTAGIGAG